MAQGTGFLPPEGALDPVPDSCVWSPPTVTVLLGCEPAAGSRSESVLSAASA